MAPLGAKGNHINTAPVVIVAEAAFVLPRQGALVIVFRWFFFAHNAKLVFCGLGQRWRLQIFVRVLGAFLACFRRFLGAFRRDDYVALD